jgi:hypothetical protein
MDMSWIINATIHKRALIVTVVAFIVPALIQETYSRLLMEKIRDEEENLMT